MYTIVCLRLLIYREGGLFSQTVDGRGHLAKNQDSVLPTLHLQFLGDTILCDVFFNNVCGANVYAT